MFWQDASHTNCIKYTALWLTSFAACKMKHWESNTGIEGLYHQSLAIITVVIIYLPETRGAKDRCNLC